MPLRSENLPPKPRNDLSGHHPSRSQEESNQRFRSGAKTKGPELDIFADPPTPEQQRTRARPRRNSDSSINSRVMSSEDEQKRRERRRREREARHRDGKGRPPPSSSKSRKPNKQLDIIDSLDVTSIFGTGGECKSILVQSPANMASSFPSRRAFRRLQSASQPQGPTKSAHASFCKRLSKQLHGRLRTTQQGNQFRPISRQGRRRLYGLFDFR